jgi:hypothetical protein
MVYAYDLFKAQLIYHNRTENSTNMVHFRLPSSILFISLVGTHFYCTNSKEQTRFMGSLCLYLRSVNYIITQSFRSPTSANYIMRLYDTQVSSKFSKFIALKGLGA